MTTPPNERSPRQEWLKCEASPLYFIDEYGYLYNATEREWMRFRLWRSQAKVLKRLQKHRLVVILKARQLGQTWLTLGYALWMMLFRPAAAVGIFSRREDEAIDLLDNRLKEMYRRLPEYLRARQITADSKKFWELSNGSWARAFPSTTGDSYTFSLAVVDEADLVPDLDRLMAGVKPTIDAGGQLILLSRVDKSAPQSAFKRIYRAAKAGENAWYPIFLPWSARPDRDETWYAAQRRDSLSRTGSLDYLHEQYPATDSEALAPRSLDKRIAPQWLERAYREASPVQDTGAPAIPGLRVYGLPNAARPYVLGADPAEGNPTSDDSALEILDALSGEEVASLAGKFQPAVFAAHIAALATWYGAKALVERNNHGHTVIQWLRDNTTVPLLNGYDGKPGWLSNSMGKTLLYDACADAFRSGDVMLHDFSTLTQLSHIEGSTLRAPSGQHDDRADAFALANMARSVGASGWVKWAQMQLQGVNDGQN